MTTEQLKRNLSALELLTNAARNQRKATIDTSTRDQLLCICDYATSILDENITLTPKQYKSLEKYQDLLRYLAKNKNYFRKDIEKRKYLNKSGGFLPLLLAPILSAAGSNIVR